MKHVVPLVVAGLVVGVMPWATGVAPARAACSEASMQIVPHQDDDILFQNPDVDEAIGSGQCVTTVFLTSGDGGYEDDYWQERERGPEAAYAKMAGVANTWTTSSVTSRNLRLRTLSGNKNITIVSMRLPDGFPLGTGSAEQGYQSLEKLLFGQISSIRAVDGSNTYTNAQLVSTLVELANYFKPNHINTLDYTGWYGGGDHSDHYATAFKARDTSSGYGYQHTLSAYLGYTAQTLSANLSSTQANRKDSIFYDAYAPHDDDVIDGQFDVFFARQYVSNYTSKSGAVIPPREEENAAPSVNAGIDQTVATGTKVTLAGTATDPEGQTLSYAWTTKTKPTSATVTLADANTTTATFTPTVAGEYVFTLTVKDGVNTVADDVKVTVTAPGQATNLAPTATVTASSAATGQAATNVVDGSILGYPQDSSKEWASAGEKAGAWIKLDWGKNVTLTKIVLYDRPNLNDQILAGRLTFSDGTTQTVPSLINAGTGNTITLATPKTTTSVRFDITQVSTTTENVGLSEFQAWGTVSSIPVNQPPSVNAGSDQIVDAGTKVTLAGTATDPEGQTLSYAWTTKTKPTSATVTLADANTKTATFTPTVAGEYVFTLTVKDGVNTVADDVKVTVTVPGQATNLAPTASVTASSAAIGQTADKAIDGSILGYPQDSSKEWASAGEKAGAWIKLDWGKNVTLTRIVLYDRPNLNDQILAGRLTFSDGTTVAVGALTNAGTGNTITLPTPKTTTSVRFDITQVSTTTENVGLAEFQAWGTIASTPPSSIPPSSIPPSSIPPSSIPPSSIPPSSIPPSSIPPSSIPPSSIPPSSAPVNQPPSVNAGIDQTVATGTKVTLAGTATDPEGQTLSYAWTTKTKPTSATVTLADANTKTATFTPTVAGEYVFTLTVKDGVNTVADDVKVTVTAPVQATNLAPTATVTASSAATGQAATNAVDGSILGYPQDYTKEWASAGEKAGAWIKLDWGKNVTLTRIVLYDRPNLNDQILAGRLTFSDGSTVAVGALTNAGTGNTITLPTPKTTTSVRFDITQVSTATENVGLAEFQAWGTVSSIPVNQPPSVNAGGDQIVATGTKVTLAGTATDPEGQTLSYAWTTKTKPTSATVTLADANTKTATFTPTVAGEYVFTLTVKDGVNTVADDVKVTVTVPGQATNLAPTATVTASSAATGQAATNAVDGSILGYPQDYTKEWASNGEKAGAWIKLDWGTNVTLTKIVLYDRPNLNDQILAGRLTFSDGSTVAVGALTNAGTGNTITLATPKTTTSVRFDITQVSTATENVGLSEFQAFSG